MPSVARTATLVTTLAVSLLIFPLLARSEEQSLTCSDYNLQGMLNELSRRTSSITINNEALQEKVSTELAQGFHRLEQQRSLQSFLQQDFQTLLEQEATQTTSFKASNRGYTLSKSRHDLVVYVSPKLPSFLLFSAGITGVYPETGSDYTPHMGTSSIVIRGYESIPVHGRTIFVLLTNQPPIAVKLLPADSAHPRDIATLVPTFAETTFAEKREETAINSHP